MTYQDHEDRLEADPPHAYALLEGRDCEHTAPELLEELREERDAPIETESELRLAYGDR